MNKRYLVQAKQMNQQSEMYFSLVNRSLPLFFSLSARSLVYEVTLTLFFTYRTPNVEKRSGWSSMVF